MEFCSEEKLQVQQLIFLVVIIKKQIHNLGFSKMLQSGSLTLNVSPKLKKKLEDIILICLLQESINSFKNIYLGAQTRLFTCLVQQLFLSVHFFQFHWENISQDIPRQKVRNSCDTRFANTYTSFPYDQFSTNHSHKTWCLHTKPTEMQSLKSLQASINLPTHKEYKNYRKQWMEFSENIESEEITHTWDFFSAVFNKENYISTINIEK